MRALAGTGRYAGRFILHSEDLNASRYTQGLQQLAGANRHGRRARPDRRQLRDLGHRRHFPRLRPLDRRQDRLDRDHRRPVPPDLQRPPAAARPPDRPPDHAGPGARAAARPAARRPARRRSRARPARAPDAAQPLRRRGRAPDHGRSEFQGPARPVRPRPLRADDPQRRLHRAALRRRAEAHHAAARARRHGERRADRAEDARAGAQSLRERAARDRLRDARPQQGRRHRAADAGGDRRPISRTQKAQFRAPEYRSIVVLSVTPAELAQARRRERRRREALLRRAISAASARRSGASSSRSCFRRWRRRRPRPRASTTSSRSRRSPRNAA